MLVSLLLSALQQALTFAGLFAPTAGAQLRREQRGRQSEYDRGTTMATAQELGIATNVATSSELQAAWARYEQDRMGDFSPCKLFNHLTASRF